MKLLMEVKRTVLIKLDEPNKRREDLRTTIEQFGDAVNYTLESGQR